MSAPLDRKANRLRLARKSRGWASAYLLLLPIFLLTGIFKYYSFGYSIVISFFEWNGMNKSLFVGLQNYVTLFKDSVFITSMQNLFIVVVFNCVKTLLMSFIAAELVLNIRNKLLSNTFKYLFIIPMVIPTMVTTLLWSWVYDYDGIFNQLLRAVGLGEFVQAWLATDHALLAILVIGLPWVSGIPFLVMLSGLQGVSSSLYEEAELEGCTYFQRMMRIDIPLLMGQIKYVLITTIIASMQFFEPIQVLTNGGPGNATMTPAMYMYKSAFANYRFGYSSAIGSIVFLLTMVITIINFSVLNNDISQD